MKLWQFICYSNRLHELASHNTDNLTAYHQFQRILMRGKQGRIFKRKL